MAKEKKSKKVEKEGAPEELKETGEPDPDRFTR